MKKTILIEVDCEDEAERGVYLMVAQILKMISESEDFKTRECSLMWLDKMKVEDGD